MSELNIIKPKDINVIILKYLKSIYNIHPQEYTTTKDNICKATNISYRRISKTLRYLIRLEYISINNKLTPTYMINQKGINLIQ